MFPTKVTDAGTVTVAMTETEPFCGKNTLAGWTYPGQHPEPEHPSTYIVRFPDKRFRLVIVRVVVALDPR